MGPLVEEKFGAKQKMVDGADKCLEGLIYTVFQKNPCDYVFDDNFNSKRPIVIIFGTVIT